MMGHRYMPHLTGKSDYVQAVFGSVVLHVALLIALVFSGSIIFKQEYKAPEAIIDAVIVDASEIKPKVKPAIKEKKPPSFNSEKQKNQALEAKRKAKALQLKIEQEKKREQERKRREALEKEKLRQERERLKAEEIEALKKQMEAQKLAELKTLEQDRASQQAKFELETLMIEYKNLIGQKISRNWIKPISTQAGFQCKVLINQIPGGEVVNVEVTVCSGDQILKRSVENAVNKASPLPYAGFERVFDRSVEIKFGDQQ